MGELDLAGDVNGDGYGDARASTHAARITGSVQDRSRGAGGSIRAAGRVAIGRRASSRFA
ncbi:MAG: hypothetical protein IT378_11435 [Sandaracinaceae bacterium]|nr:hypothetical protein [Sandaracinaceae bacterium]